MELELEKDEHDEDELEEHFERLEVLEHDIDEH